MKLRTKLAAPPNLNANEESGTESLFESALSRTYANSAVSVLSLEQALACKTGCPLLAQSLSARFRQPRRQGFLGQAIEIPYSNRLLVFGAPFMRSLLEPLQLRDFVL